MENAWTERATSFFKAAPVPFLLAVTFWPLTSFVSPAKSQAQSDLLVTAPNRHFVERFDGVTGESLGAFIEAGDGGLNRPGGVAVGPDGNVYVTSAGTSQVLRYDGETGDYIDVFAQGNGLSFPNYVGFHDNYMYVGDFSSNAAVRRFDAQTGDFIDNFIDADFIDGIEIGDDSIFVSNFFGGVGRYNIDTGEFIDQFVSPGEGGLSSPTALLELENGELLVSSYNTASVKRYSIDGEYIGDAITDLFQPEGLEIGPDGNLYAGSFGLGIINKYDIDTFDLIETFATSGPNTNFFTFRTTAVPEPSSTMVMISLVAGTAFFRRRQKSRSKLAGNPSVTTN